MRCCYSTRYSTPMPASLWVLALGGVGYGLPRLQDRPEIVVRVPAVAFVHLGERGHDLTVDISW